MKNSLRPKIPIMLIADRLEPGGAEMVIYHLFTALDREKFRPYLCCLSRLGTLGKLIKEQGFEVYCLNSKRGTDFLLPLRLARLFNQLKIRIAHTHTSTALKHAVAASIFSRTKIIIQTRHGDELSRHAIHSSSAYQILSRRADKIICICEDLRTKILQKNKISPARLAVIPNGIDIEKNSAPSIDCSAKRISIGVKDTDYVILNVANIRKEKGQDILIWAFQDVNAQFPQARLVIVGADADKALARKLRNLTDSLGISEKVIFLGRRTDVAEILACSDMFVLSSLTEGLPMSLLEAMIAGKPVVATEVGGIPEVIENGKNGILTKANSTQELAAAMKMLIMDKELAARLGEAARETVNTKFSRQQMARQYEGLYDELMKQKYKTNANVLVVGIIPPPLGGMSVYVQEQLESTLNKRYHLSHFDISKKTAANRPLITGILHQIYLILKFISTLIAKNPQVVHIHTCSYFTFWRNSIDFFIARFIFHKKVVFQIHGASFDRFYLSLGRLKKRALKLILPSANQVIALSQYWRKFFEDVVGLKNVVTVFNGISTSNYQAHYSARWNGMAHADMNILFVGEIGARKGAFDIEKTVPLISQKTNGFLFTLAGKVQDPYQAQEGNKHMQYVGEIFGEQKYRCFQDADIFILPSYAENLPLVILEAMASGLPIVATNVGGIPEIIKDGENGFLIQPGDYRALADKIIYLMEHPEMRKEMGRRNRELAIKQYDFNRVAEDLDQIYLSLLN